MKNSYGYDFENVYKLEKERMAFNFFPYPYISYFGIDPENEQLIKVQKVDRIYQPGNVVDCTPDRTYYVGTTSWYDGFGFEIKREVRHVNDLADLAKLKDTDVARVITREHGLIKINEKYGRKDEYFDTGLPILPDYTEGKLKYPTSELPKELGESIKKIFDRTQFEGEAKPISVKEHIDEEEILSTFDNNMRFTKKFEHPNWNSYREKRRTELNSAIEEQKIKQSIAPLKKELKN